MVFCKPPKDLSITKMYVFPHLTKKTLFKILYPMSLHNANQHFKKYLSEQRVTVGPYNPTKAEHHPQDAASCGQAEPRNYRTMEVPKVSRKV